MAKNIEHHYFYVVIFLFFHLWFVSAFLLSPNSISWENYVFLYQPHFYVVLDPCPGPGNIIAVEIINVKIIFLDNSSVKIIPSSPHPLPYCISLQGSTSRDVTQDNKQTYRTGRDMIMYSCRYQNKHVSNKNKLMTTAKQTRALNIIL